MKKCCFDVSDKLLIIFSTTLVNISANKCLPSMTTLSESRTYDGNPVTCNCVLIEKLHAGNAAGVKRLYELQRRRR